MRTDTFAVPPCFAVLSREQPFRVQIHPCSVTGVPGSSYFCFQKHRFAATAHKAVSVCLRLWLAPSASSLLPGDQPTSLAQRLFSISLREYTLLCDLSRSNLTRGAFPFFAKSADGWARPPQGGSLHLEIST